MKKVSALFAMLLMVLTLSITFSSCSSFTIAAAMQQIKSECPMDLGNGSTIVDADIVDGDAVVTLQASALTTDEAESFKSALVANVKSDADLTQILKDSDTKLIYRCQCSDGDVDVVVSPSDL